ncbi:hypothetical protein M1116_03470 [Patescibacteria group bacterium]|nr:hypothetical protein [Patescibacteria group bacterium]
MGEIPSRDDIQAELAKRDRFVRAHDYQTLLEDIPAGALPLPYRDKIILRVDPNSYYIAYSEKREDLDPIINQFLPKARILEIPAMTGPRRTGMVIKDWIDRMREEDAKQA